MSRVTAVACELLTSAKDAIHDDAEANDDDGGGGCVSSVEKLDTSLSSVPAECDLLPEPTLQSAVLDPVKPPADDTSLEDIEAKVSCSCWFFWQNFEAWWQKFCCSWCMTVEQCCVGCCANTRPLLLTLFSIS